MTARKFHVSMFRNGDPDYHLFLGGCGISSETCQEGVLEARRHRLFESFPDRLDSGKLGHGNRDGTDGGGRS